ncbi:hypothetical protein SANTM175S_00944 [Streptomyces antimycoticus]
METATALTFRDATDADVDELVALIESAYRGDSSGPAGPPRRTSSRGSGPTRRACGRSSRRRTAGC